MFWGTQHQESRNAPVREKSLFNAGGRSGASRGFWGGSHGFQREPGGGEISRRQQSLKRGLWKIDCLWGGIIRIIQSRMGKGSSKFSVARGLRDIFNFVSTRTIIACASLMFSEPYFLRTFYEVLSFIVLLCWGCFGRLNVDLFSEGFFVILLGDNNQNSPATP